MRLGKTPQDATTADALVLRDAAEQQDARAGVTGPLEQLAGLHGTECPGFVDHQHGAIVKPIAALSVSAMVSAAPADC